MAEPGEVTKLLQRISLGDSAAEDELLPHVYVELRRIAAKHMAKEWEGNTMQATALVHEAYLRMSTDSPVHFENRLHFFAIASRVMRRVLIDHARSRHREKRGAAFVRVSFEDCLIIDEDSGEIALAVHEALARLETLAPRQARIVEMRFFAGLNVAEIAQLLDLSERTVNREWTTARAWLYGELAAQ